MGKKVLFQKCELEAALGKPEDFDVEAIIGEATYFDHTDGKRYWKPVYLETYVFNKLCHEHAKND